MKRQTEQQVRAHRGWRGREQWWSGGGLISEYSNEVSDTIWREMSKCFRPLKFVSVGGSREERERERGMDEIYLPPLVQRDKGTNYQKEKHKQIKCLANAVAA